MLDDPSDKPPSGWWPLAAICLIDLMLLGDVGLVTVALPRIQADLHAQLTSLQWITSIYSLTLASFLLMAGTLADRWGRKQLLLAGLLLFFLAQLGNGLAPSIAALVVTRFLEGSAGALMYAVSLVVLSETYRGKMRGTAFGVWGAFTGGSIAMGPIVGGALVELTSWRAVFLVQLPICAAAIAITALKIPRMAPIVARRVDWLGTALFTLGVGLIVLTLIEGRALGWGSTPILVLAGSGALLLVAFVLVELRVAAPMLDLARFRSPSFAGAQLAAYALGAGFFALLLYLSLYLQRVLGYGPLEAALRLLPMNLLTFVVAPFAGRLVSRVSPRWPIAAGLLLTGTGVLMLRRADAESAWTTLLAGFVLIGVGNGMFNPMLGALAMSVVPRERAGMGSGISYTFRQLGLVTGVAISGAVFSAGIAADLAQRLPEMGQQPLVRMTGAVSAGAFEVMLSSVAAGDRAEYAEAGRAAFVAGLDGVFLVGGLTALTGAALVLVLVRSKERSRDERAGTRAG